MARTHYIAGNWKMNTTKAEAVALAKDSTPNFTTRVWTNP